MFVNPCRVGLRILCSVRECEVRSESGGRQSSAMAQSATVQQVARSPNCCSHNRGVYEQFMDSLCELHDASFPMVCAKATVTIARPVQRLRWMGSGWTEARPYGLCRFLRPQLCRLDLPSRSARHSRPRSGLQHG
jgi:hypothetical protein